MKLLIDCNNISKAFSSVNYVFKDINLKINSGDVIAITGYNGSGKSTLIKIISGILKQTHGSIKYFKNNESINKDEFKKYYGFVAPYLNLYEEFHPVEHLKLFARIRKIDFDKDYYISLLKQFNIFEARRKLIRDFSSGMKQRMKFVLALQHKPEILFLDEPTSNLDEEGIESVNNLVKKFKSVNKIVIMATNEEREKKLCNKYYSLLNKNEENK